MRLFLETQLTRILLRIRKRPEPVLEFMWPEDDLPHSFQWQKLRPFYFDPSPAKFSEFAEGRPRLDDAAITRIIRAYQFALEKFDTGDKSAWNNALFAKSKDFHLALVAGDVGACRTMLEDPAGNYAFYGFDDLYEDYYRALRDNHTNQVSYSAICLDKLLGLSEALAARRMWYPEWALWADRITQTPDSLLAEIEKKTGYSLDFPNIYDREYGLPSARGLICYRAIHAIYLAHRLAGLCAAPAQASVVEIGPGVGRPAYYARRFGIGRYMLVDIPVASACQAFHLMSVLGPDEVALSGENDRQGRAPVRVVSPSEFLACGETFDVAGNVDSITEMSSDTAVAYLKKLAGCARVMLSINHEANERTFEDMCREVTGRAPDTRTPYWLRRGYLEEVVRFTK